MSTLQEVQPGGVARIERIGGQRAFRRRLMELGLLPGTPVEVIRVAPFGDPLELRVRGCSISIRASDAEAVRVGPLDVARVSETSQQGRAAGLVKAAS